MSDVLHEHARRAPWRAGVEAAQTLEAAARVLRKELPACADRIRPLHVRGGTLTVLAEHPAFAQEVRLHERAILGLIHKQSITVRRIAIRIAPPTPGPSE